MKKLITIVAVTVIALAVGIALGRWMTPAADSGDTADGARTVLYWKAPMDPGYRRDGPGKSPMGMDLVPVYADEQAGSGGMDEAGIVRINPAMTANLGVRTAAAGFGPLPRQIDTVAYVAYDEDSLHQVSTRVDGWIEKLAIKSSGDPVRQGQVLFELYSPTLVNAQQEYLAALRSRNTTLQTASRERLMALGMPATLIARLDREQNVRQRIPVLASSDGVVAHLGVREGQYVTPTTEVMSIARLDQVWLMAEVFERQAAWVEPGQTAEVELDYLPGRRWEGSVDYIYPELDRTTRTLKVRIRLANEGEVLRPNMFARVRIRVTATAAVVHVPREAVIRGGTVNRVVVALGDGRYRTRAVELGVESGAQVEIRQGLLAGEQVVTSGQFLIDSESSLDLSLQRFDAPGDEYIGGPADEAAPDTVPEKAPEHAGHDMGASK